MHFVEAKGILSSNNGMNLYRGCTHGCIYCDSRSKCYGFTYDFEDIEVKANAPQLLEKALKSKRKKCMIGTGAMCDPYLHAEESYCTGRKGKEFGRISKESTDTGAESINSRFGVFCYSFIRHYILKNT